MSKLDSSKEFERYTDDCLQDLMEFCYNRGRDDNEHGLQAEIKNNLDKITQAHHKATQERSSQEVRDEITRIHCNIITHWLNKDAPGKPYAEYEAEDKADIARLVQQAKVEGDKLAVKEAPEWLEYRQFDDDEHVKLVETVTKAEVAWSNLLEQAETAARLTELELAIKKGSLNAFEVDTEYIKERIQELKGEQKDE